jgi:glycerol-3-phosphate acyltransferase PlsY
MTGKDVICVLLAYLLGGICTGYYLVQFRSGMDIRQTGSGGVGARNVGRVLGRSGFMITLLGDALKGVVTILLARAWHVEAWVVSLMLFAVVAGHIFPVMLAFRGGRGIATAIGALLVYDYTLLLILMGCTIALLALRRGFTVSGLGAFLLLPAGAVCLGAPDHTLAALVGVSVLVLFAHREHIRSALFSVVSAGGGSDGSS